jgi:hypothetical protein
MLIGEFGLCVCASRRVHASENRDRLAQPRRELSDNAAAALAVG